jgi:GT2 family glycosyltransferase
VAVAVVSAGTRDLLAACLESLAADHADGRAEVWVVDNASEDGSPEMVRERFPWVRLVASSENLGYGQAVNVVARQTEAPWVVAANSDVEVFPGALERMIRAGTADPRTGAVSPRLVLPDGRSQHVPYSFPTLPFTLLFNLGAQRLSRRLGDRLCLEGYWDADRARTVPWAIAAFLMVRSAAFAEVGGFDEEQWIYAEDLELGWRLAQGGWRTRYEPEAHVRHVGGASTSLVFGADPRQHWMAATYRWMARRRGLPRTRATALVNLAGAAVRAGLLTPLAALDRERYLVARDNNIGWVRIHREGLRPRSVLLTEARPA